MTDPASIAASLSEAQRRNLKLVRDWPTEGNEVTPAAALNWHSFRALERRDLVRHYIAGMISVVRLTPLGLAVRQLLMEADRG